MCNQFPSFSWNLTLKMQANKTQWSACVSWLRRCKGGLLAGDRNDEWGTWWWKKSTLQRLKSICPVHIQQKSLSVWHYKYCDIFVVVFHPLSCAAIPWTAEPQASLSFTISRSLLRFMSTELLTLSNHLILCHSFLLLPSIFSLWILLSQKSIR